MVTILNPPLPKQWDVVRCFMKYSHDAHPDNTHPAVVLNITRPEESGSRLALITVAGGTSSHDSFSGTRKKVYSGEFELLPDLCKGAGLPNQTKFDFSSAGIRTHPWDSNFFRWDPNNPNKHGEPLFGSLDTASQSFERFSTVFKASPEFRCLSDVIINSIRLATKRYHLHQGSHRQQLSP